MEQCAKADTVKAMNKTLNTVNTTLNMCTAKQGLLEDRIQTLEKEKKVSVPAMLLRH